MTFVFIALFVLTLVVVLGLTLRDLRKLGTDYANLKVLAYDHERGLVRVERKAVLAAQVAAKEYSFIPAATLDLTMDIRTSVADLANRVAALEQRPVYAKKAWKKATKRATKEAA